MIFDAHIAELTERTNQVLAVHRELVSASSTSTARNIDAVLRRPGKHIGTILL